MGASVTRAVSVLALGTVLLEDYTKELVVPDCSDVGSYGVIGYDLGSL